MEVVSILVERGADINKARNDGATPLYIASYEGHVEVVRVLAERGADVDKSDTGEYGDTPLTLASYLGKVEVVRALLEAGADVNKRDGRGRSPLYLALEEEILHTEQQRQDKAQIAALLREAGA